MHKLQCILAKCRFHMLTLCSNTGALKLKPVQFLHQWAVHFYFHTKTLTPEVHPYSLWFMVTPSSSYLPLQGAKQAVFTFQELHHEYLLYKEEEKVKENPSLYFSHHVLEGKGVSERHTFISPSDSRVQLGSAHSKLLWGIVVSFPKMHLNTFLTCT